MSVVSIVCYASQLAWFWLVWPQLMWWEYGAGLASFRWLRVYLDFVRSIQLLELIPAEIIVRAVNVLSNSP